MKKIFLTIALGFILGGELYGQLDPLFSQYQFNQLAINPAYAGSNEISSVDFQLRRQWVGVEGSPQTTLLSGYTSLKQRLGIGFFLLQDKVGVDQNISFNFAYAYALKLSNYVKLSMGLQTGLISFRQTYGDLTLQVDDEDFMDENLAFTKLNLGTGLFLAGPTFYLGLSMPKLLKSSPAGSSTNFNSRHFYLSGGVVLDKFPSMALKPYFVTRLIKGSPASVDVGASALLKNILWAGLFTRNLKTIGISTFLTLENHLRVGYTGELTSSRMAASGFSTHEVSVGLDLRLFQLKAASRRYF